MVDLDSTQLDKVCSLTVMYGGAMLLRFILLRFNAIALTLMDITAFCKTVDHRSHSSKVRRMMSGNVGWKYSELLCTVAQRYFHHQGTPVADCMTVRRSTRVFGRGYG